MGLTRADQHLYATLQSRPQARIRGIRHSQYDLPAQSGRRPPACLLGAADPGEASPQRPEQLASRVAGASSDRHDAVARQAAAVGTALGRSAAAVGPDGREPDRRRGRLLVGRLRAAAPARKDAALHSRRAPLRHQGNSICDVRRFQLRRAGVSGARRGLDGLAKHRVCQRDHFDVLQRLRLAGTPREAVGPALVEFRFRWSLH